MVPWLANLDLDGFCFERLRIIATGSTISQTIATSYNGFDASRIRNGRASEERYDTW